MIIKKVFVLKKRKIKRMFMNIRDIFENTILRNQGNC